MIPEEHKDSIISSGLDFMRSITECYGAEHGMELWDTIASTLGKDVKGEIFFAMMNGQFTSKLRITGAVNDRIASIRAMRTYSGLGLKEAKGLSDAMQNGGTVMLTLTSYRMRNEAIREFSRLGHAC